MHNNVFNFFSCISVVFPLKSFFYYFGPSALRLRMKESAVIFAKIWFIKLVDRLCKNIVWKKVIKFKKKLNKLNKKNLCLYTSSFCFVSVHKLLVLRHRYQSSICSVKTQIFIFLRTKPMDRRKKFNCFF